MNEPKYEIRCTERTNLGVFASRSIEEKVVIFRDTAISIARSTLPEQLTPLLLDYLFAHPSNLAWELFPNSEDLQQIFQQNPDVEKRFRFIGETFHSRSNWEKDKCIRLAAICSINAHRGRADPYASDERFECRLFPLGSRLNHACFPNSVILFEGNSIVVQSITPISCDEEITVRYDSVFSSEHSVSSPEGFSFDCLCEVCTATSPDPSWSTIHIPENVPRLTQLIQVFETLVAENDLDRALCLTDILLALAQETLGPKNLQLRDLKLKIYSLRHYVS